MAGPPQDLVFAPLGGVGEIGMNLSIYGLGNERRRQWLAVDLGVSFAAEEHLPGIDLILPDVRFLVEERKNLCGIVLTHAHEDHIGAVLDLWPQLKVPIYATPFTAAVLEAKRLSEPGTPEIPVVVVPLDSRFDVGPFNIELITMPHSIPESSLLVIRTPLGLVVHTGDWKFDGNPVLGKSVDEERIHALKDEGVTALMGVSTNALEKDNTPPEYDMGRKLSDIIKYAKKRVAVTTFASNIARIRLVEEATRSAGRHLVVVGRSMLRYIETAKQLDYLPDSFRYFDSIEYNRLPRDKVVLLCTGSQGQENAAIARIANKTYQNVELQSGDLVIFSSWTIPCNALAVAKVHNNLAQLDCEVITDSDALVHITGHPTQNELTKMYGLMAPRIAIPVHGEARHLKAHARLARAAGVPEVISIANGQLVRLAPGTAKILDEVPVGRLLRDGRFITPADQSPVRERRKLARSGIISISLVLSITGELLAEPIVASTGVASPDAEEFSLEAIILKAISGTFKSIPKSRRKAKEFLCEAVRRSIRAAVYNVWGKRPIVKVLLSTLD